MSISLRCTMKFAVIAVLAGVIALGLTSVESAVLASRPQIEKFDPNTYRGETGKITTAEHKEAHMFLKNKQTSNYLPLNGKDGTIIAPVGEYELLVVATVVTGEDDSKWSVQYRPDKVYPVSIKENSTVKLDFGAPFTASVSVKQSGSKANVDLVVTDRVGWMAGIRCMDQGAAAPKFFVYNCSKTVVWYGAFKYG